MTIADVAKTLLRTLDNNSPMILSGIAVGGVVSTVVLATKATVRATHIVDREVHDDVPYPTAKKIIFLTWKEYIPTAGMGVVTIVCIIGAQGINSRRQAALISGFTLAEGAFKEYREKVTEQMGTAKEQKVVDSITEDHIKANPPSNQVIISGKGDVLCYDKFSGHYFNCDMETLRRAQNDINLKCINEMYASQNDFYQLIGIPTNKYGDEYGWTTDNKLDLRFTAVMSDDDTPCIGLEYRTDPIRGYHKFG